jgi:hypothetical protein
VHQLFIVTLLQLLLAVIQTGFFVGPEIFNPQKKKSAKIKCLLFSPKPQKLSVIRQVLEKNIYNNAVYEGV